MHYPKFARAASIALILGAGAMLIACSGDDDKPDASPTTASTSAAVSATADTTPTTGTTATSGSAEATAGTATSPTAPAADPTSTSIPVSGHPPIGVPQYDAIASAVTLGQFDEVAKAIGYIELECTNAQGLGGPPKCPEGEVEGTVVKVLPLSACEGEYVPESNVPGLLEQLLGSAELYAAFSFADPGTEEFPKGTDGLLFATDDGAVILGVNDFGRIVSLTRGCALSAEQLYEQEKGEFLYLTP